MRVGRVEGTLRRICGTGGPCDGRAAARSARRWRHVGEPDILERTLQPISDHRGSAAYRLALAQSLLEKFWWEQHEEALA